MKYTAIVEVNPVEPARIGFRHPRAAAFQCDFTFRLPQVVSSGGQPAIQANPIGAYPQLVFRPRSRGGAAGYDIIVVDANTGRGRCVVDGYFFQDPNGYLVELYTRTDDGQPLDLIAHGAMAMTGAAYAYQGPLGPVALPTGPVGPAGPQGIQGVPGAPGAPGQRGSLWTTGSGDPVATGNELPGDQYLNVENGDVWSWSGSAWMRGPIA